MALRNWHCFRKTTTVQEDASGDQASFSAQSEFKA